MTQTEDRALTVVQRPEIVIAQKDLDMYRQHFCPDAPPNEWLIFQQKCMLLGLNPMLNEVYLVGRNTKVGNNYVKKFTTQVSITGLISLAERTKRYEGHTPPEYFDKDLNSYPVWPTSKGQYPYAIRIGVYKRGWREASTVVVYFHERAQYFGDKLSTQWVAQGIHMLLKCALAAALRWAFQETCGGVYIHEEMGSADAQAGSVTIIPEVNTSDPNTNEALKQTASKVESANIAPQQLAAIRKLYEQLAKPEPEGLADFTFVDAKQLITDLSQELREARANKTDASSSQPTQSAQSPAVQKMLVSARNRVSALSMEWDAIKTEAKLVEVADGDLTVQQIATINGHITRYEKKAS